MTTIYVGATGPTRPNQTYLRKLTFAEIALRDPLPRAKVMQEWRTHVGENFVLSLVVSPGFWGPKDWPLRDEKSVANGLKTIKDLTVALKANVLVFRSPAAVRPGSAAFQRFRDVIKKAKDFAKMIVWDPQSVWEHDQAVRAVQDLKVVVACDPLYDPVKSEPIVYARMRGLGSDRRYNDGRLEEIAEKLAHTQQGFVVFESERAVAEAVRLRAIIDGTPSVGEDETAFEDDDDQDEDDDNEYDYEDDEDSEHDHEEQESDDDPDRE